MCTFTKHVIIWTRAYELCTWKKKKTGEFIFRETICYLSVEYNLLADGNIMFARRLERTNKLSSKMRITDSKSGLAQVTRKSKINE